jgi:hypothetical protein
MTTLQKNLNSIWILFSLQSVVTMITYYINEKLKIKFLVVHIIWSWLIAN